MLAGLVRRALGWAHTRSLASLISRPPSRNDLQPLIDELILKQAAKFCDGVPVLVNREQAIARIFCINALVAVCAQQSSRTNQLLGVPLLTQTYGAGKSALADNYVCRLRDPATLAAITTMAATPEFADIKGAITDALAHFQAEGDTAPLCIRVEANPTFEELRVDIAEKATGARDRGDFFEIIRNVRRTKAVALLIDEVGHLEVDANGIFDGNGYSRYQALRNTLVMLIKDQTEGLKPLHVGVMGKVSMDFFVLAKGSSRSSPHTNFPVTLEPLRGNHVRQIYEAYTRHDHPACRAAQSIEELGAMGAFESVARLTGGVPRQTHHMLAALILSGTKLQPATLKAAAFLTDLAHKMATRMGAGWFVRIEKDTIATYVNLLACARLGLPLRVPRNAELSPSDSLPVEALFRAISHLPALLHLEGSTETHNIYSVTVAPIFALGLSRFLFDANGILGVAKAAATGVGWMDKESRIEWALLLHVLAALTASKDQRTLSLHGVFPFLAGKVVDVAVKLRQTDGIVARLDCVITKQEGPCQELLKNFHRKDDTVADKRSRLASLAGPDRCVVTMTQPDRQAVGPPAPDVILGMQQHLWGVQSKAGAQQITQADLKAEVGKALGDAGHPTVLIVMADNYGQQLEAKLSESGGVWVNQPVERVSGAGQDSTEFDLPEGTTLVVVSKEVADGWMNFTDAQANI